MVYVWYLISDMCTCLVIPHNWRWMFTSFKLLLTYISQTTSLVLDQAFVVCEVPSYGFLQKHSSVKLWVCWPPSQTLALVIHNRGQHWGCNSVSYLQVCLYTIFFVVFTEILGFYLSWCCGNYAFLAWDILLSILLLNQCDFSQTSLLIYSQFMEILSGPYLKFKSINKDTAITLYTKWLIGSHHHFYT